MVSVALSGQTEPAAAAGHLSPDGYWWWNGSAWVPVAQAQPQFAPPVAARPRRPLPWMRISAGAAAIVGVIATLVGCIIPYGTFPDPNGGPTTTSSIFSGGFSGAGWDIPEPVFVMLAAAAAATLVLVGMSRLIQGIAAGLLIGVGAEAAMMWAAYLGLAATDGSPEVGGIIGAVGAVLILVAGLLVLATVFSRQPAVESTTPAVESAATPETVAAPAP